MGKNGDGPVAWDVSGKNYSIRFTLAQHLGISRWTVSRVLNGHSGVKEETRKRVLEAMEELGFSPNRFAQGLRGKPSGLIGVSFPYLEATVLAEKSRQLQQELRESGYRGTHLGQAWQRLRRDRYGMAGLAVVP